MNTRIDENNGIFLHYSDITLRTALPSDAKRLAAWWNDGAVMAHAGFPLGLGITEEKVISQLRRELFILEKDEKPIGESNFRALNARTAEIGIKICESAYQNRGLGKIALSLLIRFLFDSGFEKILLDTNLENKRAQHVYETLGFKKLRVNHNAWKDQLGKWQSSVDYELTQPSFVDFTCVPSPRSEQQLFDSWAESYDQAVAQSDESHAYPFAGYHKTLDIIYHRLLAQKARTILDIGFGTAHLTHRLYEMGCRIFRQDISQNMIAMAQLKMPHAMLLQGDMHSGLRPELQEQKYDAIVISYALHHLTDAEKIPFIQMLMSLLNSGGTLCIGDVAFPTRQALEQCRIACGAEWDDEEHYFVFDELQQVFPALHFTATSFCAGVLTLQKP